MKRKRYLRCFTGLTKGRKSYLRVFRGLSKINLPGYVGFFQFLRNFRQYSACEQAELILQAALDPTIASRAKRGVKDFEDFDSLTAQAVDNHVGPSRYGSLSGASHPASAP